jgi:hypothetical protein
MKCDPPVLIRHVRITPSIQVPEYSLYVILQMARMNSSDIRIAARMAAHCWRNLRYRRFTTTASELAFIEADA